MIDGETMDLDSQIKSWVWCVIRDTVRRVADSGLPDTIMKVINIGLLGPPL